MITKSYTLPKTERLSWKRHIDLLFEKGQSFVAFPLRVIYLPVEEKQPAPVSILLSVSKKKFKRAVKRNQVKRQIRESYRIHKYELVDFLEEKDQSMLVAFLYLDNKLYSYGAIEKAMQKALRLLREKQI